MKTRVLTGHTNLEINNKKPKQLSTWKFEKKNKHILNIVPCVCRALFTYLIYDSLYLLTLTPNTLPPLPLLCLDNHKNVLYMCESENTLKSDSQIKGK